MADFRTLTISPYGRPIDVVVDFDEMGLHKPPGLIDNTPGFMLWVHDMVRESAMRAGPRPPVPPQPAPRPIPYQIRQIRQLEASGRLCQGRVEPFSWNDGGKCNVPGSERKDTDGNILGRYCGRHFRTAHPEIAMMSSRPVADDPVRRERALTAYRLRTEEKLSLAEIGSRLGDVSRERARQLVQQGERIPRQDALKAMREEAAARQSAIRVRMDGLSQRTSNCIKRALGLWSVDIDPQQVAAMSDDELLSLRNFGKAALAEVRAIFGPYDPNAAFALGNWVGEGVPA